MSCVRHEHFSARIIDFIIIICNITTCKQRKLCSTTTSYVQVGGNSSGVPENVSSEVVCPAPAAANQSGQVVGPEVSASSYIDVIIM